MSSRQSRKARRLMVKFFGPMSPVVGKDRAESRRKAREIKTGTTFGPRPLIIHGRVLNRRTRRHPERGQQ